MKFAAMLCEEKICSILIVYRNYTSSGGCDGSYTWTASVRGFQNVVWVMNVNPLNAKLNPICHLLALFGAGHILHVSRKRVKWNRLFNMAVQVIERQFSLLSQALTAPCAYQHDKLAPSNSINQSIDGRTFHEAPASRQKACHVGKAPPCIYCLCCVFGGRITIFDFV